MPEPSKPNRLHSETSPYLLQHAYNPVDWYPWGEEAHARSRAENKLIFLSIGYSACHWCHVMERESFENPSIASLMNQHFINIKVDREERPDIDHIYMTAVQIMTQHGGWPMSVFLTPELEPIYGGTYFPPTDRGGMPGFPRILLSVSSLWEKKREEVTRSAKQLTEALSQINRSPLPESPISALSYDIVDRAVKSIISHFDSVHGGFGQAPKFFHTMDLRLLMRNWYRLHDEKCLTVVTQTLEYMADGGIYDQLGGGFHRYSTDRQWLVPHFEKMLYDNALLTETYLEAFQITRNPRFSRVAKETLEYVLREMTAPSGGYYSTQDADTEGEEGKSFVWSREELRQSLGEKDFEIFSKYFEVSEPNWEGKIILRRNNPRDSNAVPFAEEYLPLRNKLFLARARRPSPFRDEKIVVSWNGLMLKAMAQGYTILGDERYLACAQKTADFLLRNQWITIDNVRPEQHKLSHLPVLLHSFKEANSKTLGFLDDYASLVLGLLSLYEADFNPEWVKCALDMANAMIHQFWDPESSTFLYTGKYHERLLTPIREIQDGATPSGTGLAMTALLSLARLTGELRYSEIVEKALIQMTSLMGSSPASTSQMLLVLDFLLSEPNELVVVLGKPEKEAKEILSRVRASFWPHRVLAIVDRRNSATSKGCPIVLLDRKTAVEGRTTVYWCHRYACDRPLVGSDEFFKAFDSSFLARKQKLVE